MKTYHVPIRTCVVCRQTSAKKTLLRVIRRPEKTGGGVAVDPTGRAGGRGAYVCASPECIEKAVRQRRFERSLNVPSVPAGLADELKALVPSAESVGATAP
ncbi:MAG: YlxR family protein [Armatimonadetes bacterium]|nr:YlxR family protein [Armatimonadota bacterium]